MVLRLNWIHALRVFTFYFAPICYQGFHRGAGCNTYHTWLFIHTETGISALSQMPGRAAPRYFVGCIASDSTQREMIFLNLVSFSYLSRNNLKVTYSSAYANIKCIHQLQLKNILHCYHTFETNIEKEKSVRGNIFDEVRYLLIWTRIVNASTAK